MQQFRFRLMKRGKNSAVNSKRFESEKKEVVLIGCDLYSLGRTPDGKRKFFR